MLLNVLKGKIHRARVVQAELNRAGFVHAGVVPGAPAGILAGQTLGAAAFVSRRSW